jgi:serine/threonine-protein kinase
VLLLKQKGRVREALAELRRGHELGLKYPGWTYPSAEWVRRAERMVALEGRLAAVLKGDDKPKDAAESLGFADLAYNARQFGPSARWYAEAFRAEPKLAEDMNMLNRYCAASAAVLSAAGKADDGQPQGEAANSVWRKQAIDWLRADLAHWTKQAESGTQEARGLSSQALQRWKADPSLAGIRDLSAVRGLPEEEQKACRAFWAEVENTLKKSMP